MSHPWQLPRNVPLSRVQCWVLLEQFLELVIQTTDVRLVGSNLWVFGFGLG